MSVLIIRNDDICDVYNRTVVICYTKMQMELLWDYVKGLELLSEDRQKQFFKIDIDILSAPRSMPNLKEWKILTIVLKAYERPISFGILVKLFYENFPFKRLMVDYSNVNIFICSGNLTDDGKTLSDQDLKAFSSLSNYYKKTQDDVIEASNIFKNKVKRPSEAPKILIELAEKYDLKGGRWIMFFNKLNPARWEKAFDKLFNEARKHWNILNRFNAKISAENLIICLGNEYSLAAVDPVRIDLDQKREVEDDPEPLKIRDMIDQIYKPEIFGSMGIKYKLDVVSACCIQRDNFIRPTVYQANYGEYSRNFHSLPPAPAPSQIAMIQVRVIPD